MTTTTPVRTRPTRPGSPRPHTRAPRPRRPAAGQPRPSTTDRGLRGPSAVAVPMDPRVRSRRIAVTREQGRRRLRRILVVLGALGIVAGAVGLVFSPVLDVNRTVLDGVPSRHAADARAAIGVSNGDPLLLVDTGAAVRRLEALPWVDRASVSRSLPGTLRVTIIPRVAVGWTRGAGVMHTVAAGGRVVDTVSDPPAGLPELPAAVRDASRVAAALTPSLRTRVAAVLVDHGTAILRLASGPEIRLGTLGDLGTKARAAEAVLAALAGASARYVDVQVPSAPVVG